MALGELEGQASERKGERRTAISLLLPGEEEGVLQSWGPGALGGDSAEETSPLGAGQGGTRKSSVRVGSGSRATHTSFSTFSGGGCSRKGVGEPARPTWVTDPGASRDRQQMREGRGTPVQHGTEHRTSPQHFGSHETRS